MPTSRPAKTDWRSSRVGLRSKGGSSGRGVPAPDAAGGESAASSWARNVTWRESRLPRAEPVRLAADAVRLKAAANPPCQPASPELRPLERARSGSAGGC
eukprot:8748197-Alexandrium_andersonii.AAC.1